MSSRFTLFCLDGRRRGERFAGHLTGVRYRDEILRPVAVPFVQQHHIIFQQDNARSYVARVCQDFLANHNINPLDWPPYSPDLSPIEQLWDEMDRRVRGVGMSPLLSTN